MPAQYAERLFLLEIFGATGWRLGAIALHDDTVIDHAIAALPNARKRQLNTRYTTLTTAPLELRFIDRLVADSRAVALNHTAGQSLPQQLQMALFALNSLMDRGCGEAVIRRRYQKLYRNMGVDVAHTPEDVNYYTPIDLQELGGKLYGAALMTWFVKQDLGTAFLFRLANETGVVLLPGKGFEVVDISARVSLANLTDVEYAAIGRFTRQVLDEYFADFQKVTAGAKKEPIPA